jgi:hypothetical protein
LPDWRETAILPAGIHAKNGSRSSLELVFFFKGILLDRSSAGAKRAAEKLKWMKGTGFTGCGKTLLEAIPNGFVTRARLQSGR